MRSKWINVGACLYLVWSGLICIRRCVRMCQRVCLLPCLASVKAVYIGPDGGGNSPHRTMDEQWNQWRCAPWRIKRTAGVASCHYCRLRLLQLNMNTNQTSSRAPWELSAPQSKRRNMWPWAYKRSIRHQAAEVGVCLFLRCFRVCSYQNLSWSNNSRVHIGGWPFKLCSSVAHVWNMTVQSKQYPNPFYGV